MRYQITAPRVDVNDDVVILIELLVSIGTFVHKNQEIATVETMKSSVAITSNADGFVRGVFASVGDEIPVGDPIIELTEKIDDPYDEKTDTSHWNKEKQHQGSGLTSSRAGVSATRKARLLAKDLKIDISQIDPTGDSIKVSDVESYHRKTVEIRESVSSDPPISVRPMSRYEKAMAETLEWSSKVPSPAYLAKMIDFSPLIAKASEIQKKTDLLFRPDTSLAAWIFVKTISCHREFNSSQNEHTITSHDRIHLGMTYDSNGKLLMPVLRDADQYNCEEFIAAVALLQRRAQKSALNTDELTGATIGFSSLANFGVTQHNPILYPETSVMLAHSAPLPFFASDSQFSLVGITYDHKLHSGAAVAKFLNKLEQAIKEIVN